MPVAFTFFQLLLHTTLFVCIFVYTYVLVTCTCSVAATAAMSAAVTIGGSHITQAIFNRLGDESCQRAASKLLQQHQQHRQPPVKRQQLDSNVNCNATPHKASSHTFQQTNGFEIFCLHNIYTQWRTRVLAYTYKRIELPRKVEQNFKQNSFREIVSTIFNRCCNCSNSGAQLKTKTTALQPNH